jgi:hypothetical protein
MMQVALVIEHQRGWRAPESGTIHLSRCAPFVWTRACTRVHRVRSGRMFFWDGRYSHSAITAWCGQGLTTSNGLRLTDDPPEDLPICGTCEGRARGAGQLESNLIAGREVVFSPRCRLSIRRSAYAF